MPRPILYVLLFLVALSLIPMGLVYKARSTRGRDQTRIQVVYDMDNQVKYKTQTRDDFFADGRSMRLPVEGTVAQGLLEGDDALFRGQVEGDTLFVTEFPVEVTREMVYRGRERFDIYCAPCHGTSGNGQGLVHTKAEARGEGTWTPPTDLANQTVIDRPVGHIYNTIKNGIRNMPAYGPQISPEDRWAIVAYVRALQLTRNASIEDVSAEAAAALQK